MDSDSSSYDDAASDNEQLTDKATCENYWRRTLLLMAQLHPLSPLLNPPRNGPPSSSSSTDTESRIESSSDGEAFDAYMQESPTVAMRRDAEAWLARHRRALGEMLASYNRGFPDPRWLHALNEEVERLSRDVDFERKVCTLEAIYGLCLVYGVLGLDPASLWRAQDGLVRAAMRAIKEALAAFERACLDLPAIDFRAEREKLRDAATAQLSEAAQRCVRIIRPRSDPASLLRSIQDAQAQAGLLKGLPPLPPSDESH